MVGHDRQVCPTISESIFGNHANREIAKSIARVQSVIDYS